MELVRIDRGTLGKPSKDATGILRADAHVTRSGVFEYKQADGKIVREYRPPEEVFKADSLAGKHPLPLVDDHPATGLVTPAEAARLTRGAVGEMRRDGNLVTAPLSVFDAELIAKMEAGKTQVSCGYVCETDPTPGTTPDGQRYDAVQRNIRYNHVAIVDVGRAGPEVSVRMDGAAVMVGPKCDACGTDMTCPKCSAKADADLTAGQRGEMPGHAFAVPESKKLPIENAAHVRAAMSRFGQTDFKDAAEKRQAFHAIVAKCHALGIDCKGFEDAWRGRLDAADKERPMAEKWLKVKLDGVELEVTETVAQAIAKLQGEVEKQTARADDLASKLAAAEKARTDAEDPARVSALVAARVALEVEAKKHLGGDVKLDGLTDREVRCKVVEKLSGKPIDAEKAKSDVYVSARFDAAIEHVRAADPLATAITAEVRGDEADPVAKARAEMEQRHRGAWKNNPQKPAA